MRQSLRSQPARRPAERSRVEPAERDNPLNATLDVIDQLVAEVVNQGGEYPLRMRMKRLLPDDRGPAG